MGAVKQLVQGEDLTINIQLVGEDGDPIQISNCEDVILYLYQRRENILVEIALNEMEVVSSLLGKVKAIVLGASSNFIAGRVYAEVVAKVDDADFDAGFKVNKITDIVLCDVINSVSNDN
jgi:hypothetical protein